MALKGLLSYSFVYSCQRHWRELVSRARGSLSIYKKLDL